MVDSAAGEPIPWWHQTHEEAALIRLLTLFTGRRGIRSNSAMACVVQLLAQLYPAISLYVHR